MRRQFFAIAAGLVLLTLSPCPAQVGAEFAPLEAQVAAHPDDLDARHQLAQAYAASGFAEEAAEQYLAALSQYCDDADAKSGLAALLTTHMPSWFPATVTEVRPFPLETMKLSVQAADWELLSTESFAAHEGQRADRIHQWSFPRVAYGYVWETKAKRWQLRVRVHHTDAGADLAPAALKTTLALYAVVKGQMGFDPTGGWSTPVDVWLAEGGPPGAHSAGRNIYLYSIKTARAPEEWLRELAHEYGHIALPGLGGFTKTDDAWADGELGELLFVKWFAAVKAGWLPWPVSVAEDVARPRREQLLARAAGKPDLRRARGEDVKAREYVLGLALRVEAERGPHGLAEVLARCPRGNAVQFLAVLGKS